MEETPTISDEAAREAGPREAGGLAVLIASPGAAVRSELREKLGASYPVHEVSQWDSLEKSVSTLLPGILLLDVDLLRISGVADINEIRPVCRRTHVVLLTSCASESEGVAALTAGARGYCLRDLDAAALRKAVDRVRDGEVWAERRLIPLLLDQYVSHPERRPELRSRAERRLELLTPRERQIAWMIGGGLSNRDIAARLMVGEGTVKAHLTAIFRKLGFSDRLQLGLFLVRPDARGRRH